VYVENFEEIPHKHYDRKCI